MPVLYSASHCLTIMATDAADRLNMRLENHNALRTTAYGFIGVVGASAKMTAPICVEFTKGPLTA